MSAGPIFPNGPHGGTLKKKSSIPDAAHVHGPGCDHGHDHGPVVEPFVRVEPKLSRNDPCPCGSGKKYKKCHDPNG